MDSWTRSAEARSGVRTAGNPGKRRRAGGQVLGLVTLLAAVAAGCPAVQQGEQLEGERASVEQEGTPPPPPDLTDPTAPGQRELALEYGRQLRFAEDEEYHWAWDKQHLDLVTTDAQGNKQVVRGPLGTIWPEMNSHANAPEALQRGRILARIELDGPYPKLGLPAGVSYVWVDTVPPGRQMRLTSTARRGDAQDTPRYRAVMLPEDPDAPAAVRPVFQIVHAEDGPEVQLPLARWRWSADDEFAWFTCGGDCCEAR